MSTSGTDPLDGLRVTRRLAVHSACALPALWMLSRLTGAGRTRAANDVGKLLQDWTDRTAELVAEDDPNEDAHLYRLCADLSKVDPGGFPARSAITWDKRGMKSGPVHARMPFIVIQFDLEPGTIIPAHNHVGWGFASLGVQGEATVRNYEVVGDAPEPGADLEAVFTVREVASTVLLPGRTSSLTRSRANIHWFQAGEHGATFLDFGVHLTDPGAGPRQSSSMELDPKPIDAQRRLHAARWLGDLYK